MWSIESEKQKLLEWNKWTRYKGKEQPHISTAGVGILQPQVLTLCTHKKLLYVIFHAHVHMYQKWNEHENVQCSAHISLCPYALFWGFVRWQHLEVMQWSSNHEESFSQVFLSYHTWKYGLSSAPCSYIVNQNLKTKALKENSKSVTKKSDSSNESTIVIILRSESENGKKTQLRKTVGKWRWF